MTVDIVTIEFGESGIVERENTIISADNYRSALEYLIKGLNEDSVDTDNYILAIREHPNDEK